MTTLSPQRLEKAAEAAYNATPRNKPYTQLSKFQRDKLAAEVTAAISAYLGDTHVDVPIEPTEAMVDAAYESFGCHEIFRVEEIQPGDLYRAMLSAELTERDAG